MNRDIEEKSMHKDVSSNIWREWPGRSLGSMDEDVPKPNPLCILLSSNMHQ